MSTIHLEGKCFSRSLCDFHSSLGYSPGCSLDTNDVSDTTRGYHAAEESNENCGLAGYPDAAIRTSLTRRSPLPLNTPALPHLPQYVTTGGPPAEAFATMARIKEFKFVCNSYDDNAILERWLLRLPKIATLHARCLHDGPDPNTGLWYDPDSGGMAFYLLETLDHYFNYIPRLRELYLHYFFFKPNELLDFVRRRQEFGFPLTKVQIRTPSMSLAECTALHRLVDFDHIRVHASHAIGHFGGTQCACRCECGESCRAEGGTSADTEGKPPELAAHDSVDSSSGNGTESKISPTEQHGLALY